MNTIETDRLVLRHWHDEDAQRLFELAKDPSVGPAAGWEPHKSAEESLEIIRTVFNLPTIWAMTLKDTGEIIGCCGFAPDDKLCSDSSETLLGYWIGSAYWGHGYMTEAAKACIRYAFGELHLKGIWCGNFKENTRSARVQEKCGFKYHHTTVDDHWSSEEKTVIINYLPAE